MASMLTTPVRRVPKPREVTNSRCDTVSASTATWAPRLQPTSMASMATGSTMPSSAPGP